MKSAFMWDVILCSLVDITDILEECTAQIFKVKE
jgi:hypothetical protein